MSGDSGRTLIGEDPSPSNKINKVSSRCGKVCARRSASRAVDASKALVAVAAQSLAEAQEALTMTQWRGLVIISSRSPIHLTALAEAMKVHPSNATRTVDRLVGNGLVDRKDNPVDRRHLALTLTRKGQRPVDRVMERRWEAIASDYGHRGSSHALRNASLTAY